MKDEYGSWEGLWHGVVGRACLRTAVQARELSNQDEPMSLDGIVEAVADLRTRGCDRVWW
jgi:hypothetical protein